MIPKRRVHRFGAVLVPLLAAMLGLSLVAAAAPNLAKVAAAVGPADHLTVVVPSSLQPTAKPLVAKDAPFSATVTVVDKDNHPVTTYDGTATLAWTGGSAAKALVNGEWTFTPTLTTLGDATITATTTDPEKPLTGSVTVTVVAGKFVVQASPPVVAVAAGSPFAFTVKATDASGTLLSSYAGTVKFGAPDDAAAVVPGNSPLTNGQGAFLATLNTVGQRTITATDTVNATMTGKSTLTVQSPGTATQLSVSAPSWVNPGSSFAVTVTALDQYGHVATGFNGMVWLTSTDPIAPVPSPALLTNGQGTVWTVLRTGGYQVISASAFGLSGSTTIAVGPPWSTTHFSVGAPSVVTAGVPFAVTVTALDQYGNVVTGYGGVVRFTASGWPATLPANSSLYLGSATFTVTLWTTGTESVTAIDTASSWVQGTSNTITVVSPPVVSPPAPAPSQLPPNQQFVSQLYQDLLRRQPDPSGLAFWTGALQAGVTRSAVAASVLASPEYRLQQVNDVYTECLSRGADPAGQSLYASLLGQGWTPEALEAAFVGSDEYFVTHGGNIPDWVVATYQDLLGRAPEPAGLGLWSFLAGLGVPRTQIASAIQSSGEYRALLVTNLYQSLLGRSPAAWEIGFWSQVLAKGATDNQVIAAIVGSPEYLVHAM